MTRAFLVRHGTTTWNERGVLQGWSDASLTSAGRREAASAGAAIAATREPERVVTSPLSRAVETAEIVADRLGVDAIETEPGWRERSFGSLEGQRAEVVFDDRPELHPKSTEFDARAAFDGESCRTVADRVRERWQAVRETEEPLVVVTHETPLRIATGLIDDEDPIEAIRTRSFAPGATIAVEGLPAAETEAEAESGMKWATLEAESNMGGAHESTTMRQTWIRLECPDCGTEWEGTPAALPTPNEAFDCPYCRARHPVTSFLKTDEGSDALEEFNG